MTDSVTFKNGLTLKIQVGTDGGGPTQYRDFLSVIPESNKYNRCLEWCAGCSAISFSLIDAGIINELVLTDIYNPALIHVLMEASKNNLSNITAYNIDKIGLLPEHEKFDLVVANPPHCYNHEGLDWALANGRMGEEDLPLHRRLVLDQDWEIHKEFFANITKYLNVGAELFISENNAHQALLKYAHEAGLTLVKIYTAPELTKSAEAANDCVIIHWKYEKKIH